MKSFENHLELPSISELKSSLLLPSSSLARVRDSRFGVVCAALVLLLFLLSFAALAFAPWVQTVQGSGRIMAYSPNERQQNLDSPVDGRIKIWYVSEGQKVKAGDPLVDIEDMDPDIMQRLFRERDATETKLKAAQQSLEASQLNVGRQRLLWEKGLSARRTFELAELEYAKFLSEISSVAAELARIETKVARQASQSIIARRDGIIQRIFAPEGGALVKQGERLAVIVPESTDRAVELFVTGNDIPLLSVGREVRLQFEGWPAVQISGWPSVAVGTFSGTMRVIDPSDDDSGKFRVIVFPTEGEVWPEPRYLRQGVRVIGWILLDTVKLGWEAWRIFNSFPLNPPHDLVPTTAKVRIEK